MSVKVKILNEVKNQSDEALAAESLRQILADTIPDSVTGQLNIVYSLTLVGQEVRDVDLLLFGTLDNYVLKNYYTNDSRYPKKDLSVRNLCMAIELKRHTYDRIKFSNTHFLVEYKSSRPPHDATEQNEKQRYSLKNYLNIEGLYVTNFVWFPSVSPQELIVITSGNHKIGALPSVFEFKDIVQMAINQKNPVYYDSGEQRYVLEACSSNSDIDIIRRKLSGVKPVISPMTRRRMEILSQQNSVSDVQKILGAKDMVILKGNPGTGKTFLLLQTALTLADKYEKRCLILTYNHALVSDIRRLLHYMDVPDGICSAAVNVQTLHSFFISLMKTLDIDTSDIMQNNFENNYNKKLSLLSDVVNDLMNQTDIDVLKSDNELAIDWDYIFIDEAQDWKPIEKSLLFKIYGPKSLVIADGGQQFIRNFTSIEWGKKNDSFRLTLNKCRRQKSNLVAFANAFADKVGINYKSDADPKNPGGRIFIKNKYTIGNHASLQQYCMNSECDAYDLLLLVPPSLVVSDGTDNQFKYLAEFEKNNLKIFDGTSFKRRSQYPVSPDECRLFQYESCRGLEGWVTVCMAFDKMYEAKMKDFRDNYVSDGLALETKEESIKKRLFTWLMMPLTRAIDTLYITIKDSDSPVSKILKQIADEHKDFIECDL